MFLPLFYGTVFLFPLTTPSRVLELSDRFLEEGIRREGVWLVKFYAPWCGHCKKLEPVYNHVAQALHDTPVRVARVDCTRFPSVAKEFGVQGFPTIMFIKPHSSHTYNGDRTSHSLISFAKKLMGPPVQDFGGESSSESFMLFRGQKGGQLWEEFFKLAAANQEEMGFFWKEEGEEQVTLHHPSQQIINYTPDHTLFEFLTRHKYPHWVKITPHNFHSVMATGKVVAMAVVEEDKLGNLGEEEKEFLQVWEKWVEQRAEGEEDTLYGYTPSPPLANSIIMATLPTPSLLFINSSTHHHHILSITKITPQILDSFHDDIVNNRLLPLGGKSWFLKIYRGWYELSTNLGQMFGANPVLTSLMFGLPGGFLILIFYSVCCGGVEFEGEELEEGEEHEKRE